MVHVTMWTMAVVLVGQEFYSVPKGNLSMAVMENQTSDDHPRDQPNLKPKNAHGGHVSRKYAKINMYSHLN